MSTRTLISVEEYLRSSYEPDCDFVDGEIEERNVSRVEVRINDFLAMGVRYVWVLDPETKQAFVANAADGLREVKSGLLRAENPLIELPLSEACL